MLQNILGQLAPWRKLPTQLPEVPISNPDQMQYTTLGNTGIRVSVMGLGSGGRSRLGLGQGNSLSEATTIVHQALASGINLIDTAEGYDTEMVIGKAIQAISRDKVVLSTKKQPRHKTGGLINAKTLRQSLNRSLKSLKTDYIDIYHLHGVKAKEYDAILETLVPTLESLKNEGKNTLYWCH
jgi:aryl-alcohol dehydrogenase-like predicted oxidoreductase